ncbi:MAG: hypothetical protein QOG50_1242, partial [Actinomycetota bacterium]|nr:hypothetical protein [Actinomycetota bacterium]
QDRIGVDEVERPALVVGAPPTPVRHAARELVQLRRQRHGGTLPNG